MKRAIKELQKHQDMMIKNTYPGYPYQDSVIVDLETNKAYNHFGYESTKDTILNEIYLKLLYMVIGHSKCNKPTWLQDRKIETMDYFCNPLFDSSELYIDNDLAARFYLAIQSALCYIHDNKIEKGYLWACIDCDCEWIECKVFKDYKEIKEYSKEYLVEEE